MVPAKAASGTIEAMLCATVVLPFVPVTPTTVMCSDGEP